MGIPASTLSSPPVPEAFWMGLLLLEKFGAQPWPLAHLVCDELVACEVALEEGQVGEVLKQRAQRVEQA